MADKLTTQSRMGAINMCRLMIEQSVSARLASLSFGTIEDADA